MRRDPLAVARDVRLGFVSADRARADYRVVITNVGGVDFDATQALRKETAA